MKVFHRLRILRGVLLSILSKPGRSTLRISRRLAEQYGHTRSVRHGRPENSEGCPWPWYTYPAIEYLEQLDLRDWRVFEYGCGNSTLFWSKRTRLVRSVEHSRGWYDVIVPQAPANCRIVQASIEFEYVGAIGQMDQFWNLIVVDGQWRPQCAARAVSHLAKGGMIIIDNSDWYPGIAEKLRSHGFLQVDFSGFGPVNNYAWTTSIFFDRTFSGKPLAGRQPKCCLGGIEHIAE